MNVSADGSDSDPSLFAGRVQQWLTDVSTTIARTLYQQVTDKPSPQDEIANVYYVSFN